MAKKVEPMTTEEVARLLGVRFPRERREEQMKPFYAWLQEVKDQAVLDAAEDLVADGGWGVLEGTPYRKTERFGNTEFIDNAFNDGIDEAYEWLINYAQGGRDD